MYARVVRDPGRKPDASSAWARWLVVAIACGALACGCKRGTPENVETFLGAVERQVDHGVNLALAVCKPSREEQAALRATTTTNAFGTLLAQLEACTAAGDCAAPTKTDRTDDAERALAEEPRAFAEATRSALSTLLAKTDAKTRASADEVLRDATKTMEASAKLARICGSPSQAMDTPQAMTAVDGARAQFRSAVKTMRTEAK